MNIQFHLTNTCNLRCKHCYQGEYNKEIISLKDFVYILDKTKKFFESVDDNIYAIRLTGGEPLCVPNIEKYVLEADSYCENLGLLTNGILLNPTNLEIFKQAKNFCKIQVSLEGPEDINDEIRGKGTYKKIRQAIKYIREADLKSSVSCTLAPYNYNRIEELYDDLIVYDSPNVLWFDRCIPFKGTEILTKEQFEFFIDTLRKLRLRWKQENLFTKPAVVRALQWLTFKDNEEIPRYTCGAGLLHFTIMYNGDVMICRRLNFPVGNLFKESWEEIIERIEPTLEVIHSLPTECKECKYAIFCNGGLKCLTYATFKDFNHKDINCYL